MRRPPAVPDRPLLQLARAELHRAKQLRTFRLLAHGMTLAVGIAGLWLSGRATYLAALGALVCEGAAWLLRRSSREHHSRGETGKRIVELRRFYDPAAGRGAESAFRAQVSRWACGHAAEKRFDDSEYWAAPAGTGRMSVAAALRESAFWSWRLYALASRLASLAAAVAVGVSVLLVFVFVLADLDGPAEAVARLTILVVAALISADALTLATEWSQAASASRSAYETLGAEVGSDADLILIYADYRTVTASTEPVPDLIYRRQMDRLNAAWKAENS